MSGKPKVTELSEMGEFQLIEHLTADIKLQHKSSLRGIGDDAAVLDYGRKKIVVTTDLLTEGIHFNLVYTPLKHLGYKAVVVNLSDIYAMNAIPRQLTVSLAVSGKFSVEALELLYSGIKLACERYGVDLVGGDTTSSITGMVISITAVGEAEKGQLVYRNTAKKDDLICVSGDLGGAYIGLQLLERERKIFESDTRIQPALEGYEYVLERQLKPEARRDIILKFREEGIKPTSLIDISDGLSSDLLHICKQSGKGCRIYQEQLPIATETRKLSREMNIEPFICALNGGEDYELLFTIPPVLSDDIRKIDGISVIGRITGKADDCKFITKEGHEIVLQARGWNTLKKGYSSSCR